MSITQSITWFLSFVRNVTDVHRDRAQNLGLRNHLSSSVAITADNNSRESSSPLFFSSFARARTELESMTCEAHFTWRSCISEVDFANYGDSPPRLLIRKISSRKFLITARSRHRATRSPLGMLVFIVGTPCREEKLECSRWERRYSQGSARSRKVTRLSTSSRWKYLARNFIRDYTCRIIITSTYFIYGVCLSVCVCIHVCIGARSRIHGYYNALQNVHLIFTDHSAPLRRSAQTSRSLYMSRTIVDFLWNLVVWQCFELYMGSDRETGISCTIDR